MPAGTGDHRTVQEGPEMHRSNQPWPAPTGSPYAPPLPYLRTSGLAIASLVLGLLWIGWLGSLLAIIFGHQARTEIRRSGGQVGGDGMAVAGLVLGYIGASTFCLLLLAITAGSGS